MFPGNKHMLDFFECVTFFNHRVLLQMSNPDLHFYSNDVLLFASSIMREVCLKHAQFQIPSKIQCAEFVYYLECVHEMSFLETPLQPFTLTLSYEENVKSLQTVMDTNWQIASCNNTIMSCSLN